MCVCVVCLSEGSHVTLLSALLPFLMGAFVWYCEILLTAVH